MSEVYFTTLFSNSEKASNKGMTDELERIWKESVVFLGETDENYENDS
jgi:hypothetical protein